jgi:hypothetical protein
MPTEIQTMVQVVEFGMEVTHGVTPGTNANRQLPTLKVDFDPDFQTTQYAPEGYRFDTASVPSKEASKLKFTAPMSYVEQAYTYAWTFGDPVINTPPGAINARRQTWGISITGLLDPRSVYLQKGDPTRARSANWVTVKGFTLSVDRKECKYEADAMGQRITTGVTLTASPTIIEEKEVQPLHWNVYLDTTSALIGTTLLARCYAAKVGYADGQVSSWPLGRANPSYATVLNQKPKLAVMLTMMANSDAENLYVQARAAGKVYIRLEAIGDIIDNLQTIAVASGAPTGGTFTLTYKGQTTGPISFSNSTHVPTAATVQTALQGLSTIGTSPAGCTCSGGPLDSTPIVVSMANALLQDTTALTHADSLTPSGTLSITQSNFPYAQVIDMCAVPQPDNYGDTEGAFTEDVVMNIVTDPLWTEATAGGTAINIYTQNKLTAVN